MVRRSALEPNFGHIVTQLSHDEKAVAVAAKGFMPADEGMVLFGWAIAAVSANGAAVEIGSYCGKSSIYLGSAARQNNATLFTIDHHRGSEELDWGWEHHDPETVSDGRINTLPFLRSNVSAAGLEKFVLPVVGGSAELGRVWRATIDMLFIDGGHSYEIVGADFEAWEHKVRPGGCIAMHDVYEDPQHGGQGPFEVWRRAVESGWADADRHRSLRLLRKPAQATSV